MDARKQSSTGQPALFLMTLASDHVTGASGLTPTVTLSKNGGAFAAAAGAVTGLGSGWYALAGNATDRDTLGELALHASAATADPADQRYVIVPWDPFDANQGLANLDAAVSGVAAAVWVVGTRTLTAFSFAVDISAAAVTAIWAATTRTLTSFGTLVADIWSASTAETETSAATRATTNQTEHDATQTAIGAIPAADSTVKEYLRTRKRVYEYATEPTASYEALYDAAGTAVEKRWRIYRDLSGGSVRDANDPIIRRDAEVAA